MRVPASVSFTKNEKAAPARASAAAAPRAATVPAAARDAQARAAAAVHMRDGRPVMPRVSRAPEPEPAPSPEPEELTPGEPRTWQDVGIDPDLVEQIVLRYMLGAAGQSGRRIAAAVCLPLNLVRQVLDNLKNTKHLNYRGTTAMGDFLCELTQLGIERALESRKLSAYVGPTPVPFDVYVQAVGQQSLAQQSPGTEDLQRAFSDLQISEDMLERLGPAVTSCRAMFLYGEPGNGKTSLAERITRCYGEAIWIPYVVSVGGHIVKVFDPAVHKEVPHATLERFDRRWVRIRRPTVIAGGELTLDMLDLTHDEQSNVCESPLQMKANCGTMVVDDFGRGQLAPKDLLNRWIFPLEKRMDFLQLPDGRKFSVPFDCLMVFSTNLEPRDLADEAFMRRIPYKIYVGDPLEDEFGQLVEHMAEKLGVRLQQRSVKYLIDRHYNMPKRPMRFCHPRDLLQQVVHLCKFERREVVAGPKEWDRVVQNYFGLA